MNKTTLSGLAGLFVLASATPCLAGDVTITVTGTVTQDTYNFGPYQDAQSGDTVVITFDVDVPGTDIQPGTHTAFSTNPAEIQVSIAGGMPTTATTGSAELEIEDDNPNYDGFTFTGGLGNGDFFGAEFTAPTNLFSTTAVDGLAGVYNLTGTTTTSSLRFTGAGGFLGMSFDTLEITSNLSTDLCIDFSTTTSINSLGGQGAGQSFFPQDVAGYSGQSTLDLTGLSLWSGNQGGAGNATTYLAIYDGNPDTASLVGMSTNFIDTSSAAGVPAYTEWHWEFASLTLDAATHYWAVMSSANPDVNPTTTVGRSLQVFDPGMSVYGGHAIIANRNPHNNLLDLRFKATFEGGSGQFSTFCDPADLNSTGGSTQLSAAMTNPGGSGLHLDASGGPTGEFGYFLVGTASADPGLAVSDGHLCLDANAGSFVGRYNITGGVLNSVGQFDASGNLANIVSTSTTGFGYDVPTTVPISGSPTIMAGSTWHFQLWHRDTPAGGGHSNFSNGITVVF